MQHQSSHARQKKSVSIQHRLVSHSEKAIRHHNDVGGKGDGGDILDNKLKPTDGNKGAGKKHKRYERARNFKSSIAKGPPYTTLTETDQPKDIAQLGGKKRKLLLLLLLLLL